MNELRALCVSMALLFGLLGCSSLPGQSGAANTAETGVEDDERRDASSRDDALGDASPGDASADAAEPDVSDAGPATTGETLRLKDLAYTPPPGVESELATLDLYRVDDDRVRPLVLMIHGGSWASGDKAGFEERFVPWWLEQGYVAAAVNFRLASTRGQTPVVKPADQVRDIAAALAWLSSNADTYQIATEGVVLLGYSSGAHLAALLGTDERFLQGAGLREAQVDASISLDIHVYDVPYALSLMVGSVVEQNMPIIRHLFGDTEAEQLEGSPISYLDGWAASALIVSVDEDPEVEGTHGYIVSNAAARYVAALEEAGHSADRIHDRTETHSSLVMGFGEPGDQVTQKIQEFLATLPNPPE